jgi:hypothetical protein
MLSKSELSTRSQKSELSTRSHKSSKQSLSRTHLSSKQSLRSRTQIGARENLRTRTSVGLREARIRDRSFAAGSVGVNAGFQDTSFGYGFSQPGFAATGYAYPGYAYPGYGYAAAPGCTCAPAFYEFARVEAAQSVLTSPGMRTLVLEFDRAWGTRVRRTRDILQVVQSVPARAGRS